MASLYASKLSKKDVAHRIDNSWLPTLLSALNDGIKYNAHPKRSEAVKDSEDIEEWLLQMHQFKQYLLERLSAELKLLAQCSEYLHD